jgi:hypothetical protein
MKTAVLAFAAILSLHASSARAQAPAGTGSTTTQTTTTSTTTKTTAAATTIPSTGTTTRPTYEFSLGYQYLHTGAFCAAFDSSDCLEDKGNDFPFGLVADGVRNWGALGLVGEVGWSRRDDSPSDAFADQLTTDHVHYGAGLRFTARPHRIWPYAQIIGGGLTSRFDGQVGSAPFQDTRSRVMIQASGGVTFVVGDGWGIFVDGGWRRIFLEQDEDFQTGRNDARGVVGFRMILD